MNKKYLLIGEVFVDVLLNVDEHDYPSRLGGIFHAARAFSAINAEYSIAFFAPGYLLPSIEKFSSILKAKRHYCLGVIDEAPNLMIIGDPTESGNQHYFNPLFKQRQYIHREENLSEIIVETGTTDVLFFPGCFDNLKLLDVLVETGVNLHFDLHYDFEGILDHKNSRINTVFTSTSSLFFEDDCEASIDKTRKTCIKAGVSELVVKENRGGSVFFSLVDGQTVEGDSFPVSTCHSVGVGDVFDSVFLAFPSDNVKDKLTMAALISSSYASTLDFERFKSDVSNILLNKNKLVRLKGIRLPWGERQNKNIYIAAPDFPNVDKKHLNEVVNCLEYHNFKVRLPIRENGLITDESSDEEKKACYFKDLKLLEECDLLIAVALHNDPGMYVELGMFVARGRPAILFDPDSVCMNNFVIHAPRSVCRTKSELIDTVFRILGE